MKSGLSRLGHRPNPVVKIAAGRRSDSDDYALAAAFTTLIETTFSRDKAR